MSHWIRNTGKPEVHKFQQLKVMSWKLFETEDNGTVPRYNEDLMPHPIGHFYGEMKICEMPGQPVSAIRATVGSELCLLHGPDTSILLKDFYVKDIQIQVKHPDREYSNPFMWNDKGQLVPDEGQMLDDLRNTIWIMTFRYTSVELASKPIQDTQFIPVEGAGWGNENKDGTKRLPDPLRDKIMELQDSAAKNMVKRFNEEIDSEFSDIREKRSKTFKKREEDI